MRGVFAGLILASLIVIVALLIATLGALGVAAIGWLLNRWFGLTQWQGSLIALAVALSIGFALYRFAEYNPPVQIEPEWVDLVEEDEHVSQEPPVVAWRRQRPTEGQLPPQKRSQKGQRPK